MSMSGQCVGSLINHTTKGQTLGTRNMGWDLGAVQPQSKPLATRYACQVLRRTKELGFGFNVVDSNPNPHDTMPVVRISSECLGMA